MLVVIPFRTEKEAISIANHGVSGTAAGVWTENVSVALEVASMLQVATVWVNTYGLLDAACGAGGLKASGFGRSGGKEVNPFSICLPIFLTLIFYLFLSFSFSIS